MQLFLTISAFHPHTRLELMTQSVRVQTSLIIVRVLQLHAHIWLNQNPESYYEQNKQLTLLLLTPDLPSNMIMISHFILSSSDRSEHSRPPRRHWRPYRQRQCLQYMDGDDIKLILWVSDWIMVEYNIEIEYSIAVPEFPVPLKNIEWDWCLNTQPNYLPSYACFPSGHGVGKLFHRGPSGCRFLFSFS